MDIRYLLICVCSGHAMPRKSGDSKGAQVGCTAGPATACPITPRRLFRGTPTGLRSQQMSCGEAPSAALRRLGAQHKCFDWRRRPRRLGLVSDPFQFRRSVIDIWAIPGAHTNHEASRRPELLQERLLASVCHCHSPFKMAGDATFGKSRLHPQSKVRNGVKRLICRTQSRNRLPRSLDDDSNCRCSRPNGSRPDPRCAPVVSMVGAPTIRRPATATASLSPSKQWLRRHERVRLYRPLYACVEPSTRACPSPRA